MSYIPQSIFPQFQNRIPPSPDPAAVPGPEPRVQRDGGALDVLHLPGVRGHPAAAVHGLQDGRGGVHHVPLPVRARLLQGTLYLQLGLQILLRG